MHCLWGPNWLTWDGDEIDRGWAAALVYADMFELVELVHMLEHGAVLELAAGNPLVEVDIGTVLVVVVHCSDPYGRMGDLGDGRARVRMSVGVDKLVGVEEPLHRPGEYA